GTSFSRWRASVRPNSTACGTKSRYDRPGGNASTAGPAAGAGRAGGVGRNSAGAVRRLGLRRGGCGCRAVGRAGVLVLGQWARAAGILGGARAGRGRHRSGERPSLLGAAPPPAGSGRTAGAGDDPGRIAGENTAAAGRGVRGAP